MVHETRKILGDESIQVCPTCVRVPVSNCHSESILVETERKLSADEARELFAAAPGIVVIDDLAAKQYPMPLNCDGRDEVFIGRIRQDICRATTAWRSGASATICAKAPRRTPCRSPNCSPPRQRHRRRSGGGVGEGRAGTKLRPVSMRTFKLTLAYDGTNYAGWQMQPGKPTIQSALETACSRKSPARRSAPLPAVAPMPAFTPSARS